MGKNDHFWSKNAYFCHFGGVWVHNHKLYMAEFAHCLVFFWAKSFILESKLFWCQHFFCTKDTSEPFQSNLFKFLPKLNTFDLREEVKKNDWVFHWGLDPIHPPPLMGKNKWNEMNDLYALKQILYDMGHLTVARWLFQRAVLYRV